MIKEEKEIEKGKKMRKENAREEPLHEGLWTPGEGRMETSNYSNTISRVDTGKVAVGGGGEMKACAREKKRQP